ncbi:MAG: XdhC/CoxI family protein [Gaiellales bacterium]
MSLVARLAGLAASGERAVLFTVVEGEGVGGKALVVEDAETLGGGVPEAAVAQFDELVRGGRNKLLTLADGSRVFAEWYGPPPRLVVYGAVDTAESLCQGAKLLGWTAIVADARAMFLTPERIPSADRLIAKWPKEAFDEIGFDHQTAVIVLTHDDKFDEPALIAALETEAFYIGALGSRRNQERRRERLLAAGIPGEKLERIQGPCGLDIGADTQAETALSMLAEVLAVRAGRGGGPLRLSKERIHVEVA